MFLLLQEGPSVQQHRGRAEREGEGGGRGFEGRVQRRPRRRPRGSIGADGHHRSVPERRQNLAAILRAGLGMIHDGNISFSVILWFDFIRINAIGVSRVGV